MAFWSPFSQVTTLPVPVVVSESVATPRPATTLWVAGVPASAAPVHTSMNIPRSSPLPPKGAVTVRATPVPTPVKMALRQWLDVVPALTRDVNVYPVAVGVLKVMSAPALTSLTTTMEPDGAVKEGLTREVVPGLVLMVAAGDEPSRAIAIRAPPSYRRRTGCS
jgi:hypothetical protein